MTKFDMGSFVKTMERFGVIMTEWQKKWVDAVMEIRESPGLKAYSRAYMSTSKYGGKSEIERRVQQEAKASLVVQRPEVGRII